MKINARDLIRTKSIDPYTRVICVDQYGNIANLAYGELGSPLPYILESDLEVLFSQVTRTFADRYAFIIHEQVDIRRKKHGLEDDEFYIEISMDGTCLCGKAEQFQDITEAIDYVMDMELMTEELENELIDQD